MTEVQLRAKMQIASCLKYLTDEEYRTLNLLVERGDIIGAVNGLQTILESKKSYATGSEN